MKPKQENSLCNGTDEEFELMKAKFGAQIVCWPELHQTLIEMIREEKTGKGNQKMPSISVH